MIWLVRVEASPGGRKGDPSRKEKGKTVELCAYESKSEVARRKQGIVEVQPWGLR